MKKWIIFSDVHLCGPLAMHVNWEYGPNCVYLGDNVDLTHCRKKDLPAAMQMYDFLKGRFGVFCNGNHDHAHKLDYLVIYDNIGFGHGDKYLTGTKWSDLFRTKEYGKGSWLNYMWQQFIDKIVAWMPLRISKSGRRLLEFNAIDNHLRAIVLGHLHVKRLRVIQLTKHCTLYIVPRGRTELYL
jgi:hypothetical protein